MQLLINLRGYPAKYARHSKYRLNELQLLISNGISRSHKYTDEQASRASCTVYRAKCTVAMIMRSCGLRILTMNASR